MDKNKQWICSFIVLFILISGMWIGNVNMIDIVKADSTFLSPKTQSVSVKETTNAVLSDVAIEPAELLCMRNVISSRQITAHLIHSERVIKISMVFLCMVMFALLLSNFYTTERVTEYLIQDSQTVVLSYIHNIDGKKDASLFW